MSLSVGLPRMHKEAGEQRDFLPGLVHALEGLGASDLVLEHGYGEGVDARSDDYLANAERVRFAELDECLTQDVVLVIRCPNQDSLRSMKPGALLVTMLHYPTRPGRNELLQELGIRGVSLDSITDDRGRRIVENMELVGWSGVGAAFRVLADTHAEFATPTREPIRVTCLGSGAVGVAAIHAASRYGDPDVRNELNAAHVPGVEVAVVDHDLTWHERYMLNRLRETDLLIDATHRPDPSVCVVPNPWIAEMPPHAVLVDLAADPYDPDIAPPLVKGIEGIPHGDLDQYVFGPGDPAWNANDDLVDTTHRRTTLSCSAWPGVRPRASMALYGEQLERVMEVILTRPIDGWSRHSPFQRERAVARAELTRWLNQG